VPIANNEDQEMAEAKFYGDRNKALEACQQEVSESHKRPIISSMHLVFQNNLAVAGNTVYHHARAIPGDR
jgi:hypothetical protein